MFENFSYGNLWHATTEGRDALTFNQSTDRKLTTVPASTFNDYVDQLTAVMSTLTVVIGAIGAAANGLVLFSIIFLKDAGKNATNVFICNQTVLDFIACVTIIINTLIDFSSITGVSDVVAWIVCYVLFSDILFVVPIYASQAGLVVITVERYAKIVHPIAHRKHFRSWMIKVGVLIPWLTGVALYLVPNWATSRVVDGICESFGYWAHRKLFVAYVVIAFVITLIIPVTVFVMCYGRIIGVITRQSKQVSCVNAVALAGSDSRTVPPSIKTQSQKKVVRTMLMVCVSYFVCWFPIKFYIMSVILRWMRLVASVFYALTLISYCNMLLNPIIYGSHFDVIGRACHSVGTLLKLRGGDAEGQASYSTEGNIVAVSVSSRLPSSVVGHSKESHK